MGVAIFGESVQPFERQTGDVTVRQTVEARFTKETYLPYLTVDCVIFGFHGGELKVLLLEWNHLGQWSLPGGPIRTSQSVDEAAHAILEERTGLRQVFLQQFHTFGATDRGEAALERLFKAMEIDPGPLAWLAERAVSVGYYALVDFSNAAPTPDAFSVNCRWWDVADHPSLLFDHDEMIEQALLTLQRRLTYEPVGLRLLPDKFTMPELQQLYETVLGRTLDRRNFNRKIKSLGIVERLDERRTGVAHRAPYLYRFDRERYELALNEGLAAGF